VREYQKISEEIIKNTFHFAGDNNNDRNCDKKPDFNIFKLRALCLT
jgi:hypothetical protein